MIDPSHKAFIENPKQRESNIKVPKFDWNFDYGQSETLSDVFKEYSKNLISRINSRMKDNPSNCACSPFCCAEKCECQVSELPVSTPVFNYKNVKYLMENNSTFLDHENGTLFQESIEGKLPYYIVYKINHKKGDFEFDKIGDMHIFGQWLDACCCGSDVIEELKGVHPGTNQFVGSG